MAKIKQEVPGVMTAEQFRQYTKQQTEFSKPKTTSEKDKAKSKKSEYLTRIKLMLKQAGIEFQEEYRFDKLNKRRWKFDIAIMETMTAIEYEGINSNVSRHTTIKGFTEDCNKYNEAQKQGWKVFRYTVLNYGNVLADMSYER